MFPHDIQGVYAAAVPGDVVAPWALAALVAAIVTFVGWCWGRTLDLKRDASWIVVACVGACLLWSGMRARQRAVIRSAHGPRRLFPVARTPFRLNRDLPSGDRGGVH